MGLCEQAGSLEPPLRVFLDDRRDCPSGWTLARNPHEFFKLWDARAADITAISFDHNLGFGEANGSDVAEALWDEIRSDLSKGRSLKVVGFHSDDPVHARRAADALRKAVGDDPRLPRIQVLERVPDVLPQAVDRDASAHPNVAPSLGSKGVGR